MKEDGQETEAFRQRFNEAQEFISQYRQEAGEKLSDEIERRAHELQEDAWDYAISRKDYDPERAIRLIAEAAELDPQYEPQIQLIRNWIDRRARKGKVNIKKAIQENLQPFMLEQGFEMVNPVTGEKYAKWNEDAWFRKGDASIFVSRTKFGNELGVLVAKINEGVVEYFSWRKDAESDLLAYLNQDEMNEAIVRLKGFLDSKVFPWIEDGLR